VVLARALGVDPWRLTRNRPASAELADLRDWAGMTRRDLAAAVRLTRETYSRLERGQTELDDEVAEALAGALERDIGEIRRAHRRTVRRVRAEPAQKEG
jgi:transcriptional regulator with XRE-family HTH domain